MLLFVILGFFVAAGGIAYQLGFLKWSSEEVASPAVNSSSKHSQKPSSDVGTANSPSYATSPCDEPSKDVSTARIHSRSSSMGPSNDVDTANSPSYATSPSCEPSKDVSTARMHSHSSSIGPSSNVDTANSPSYGATPVKESGNNQVQQPVKDDQQPSTANSLSSASGSFGGSDDDKKALKKKKKKKHKKSHSKHKKGILGKSLSKRKRTKETLDNDDRKASSSEEDTSKAKSHRKDSSAPTSGCHPNPSKRSGHPKLVRLARVSSPSEIELRTNGHQSSFQNGTDSSERKRVLVKARTGTRTSASDDEEVPVELTEAEKTELLRLEELCKSGDHSHRLLYFAKKGLWDSIRHLLLSNKHFDFTLTDQEGYTSLLLAVKASKVDLVETMLEKGADLYAITKERMTAVHVAARWANDYMLQRLIDKKMDVAKPAGAFGRWPIHQACQRTSSKAYHVVQCLLHTNRASRLAVDKKKTMPIHLAIKAENMPIVQLLLTREVDSQIRKADGEGNTPLHLAAQRSNDMLKLVVEAGGGEDVNTQNAMGRTPLHEVAKIGDERMLKTMWKLNANANIMDKEEKTPLHAAAERGHTHVVETLIDKFESSIRARTRDGSTLLHIAASTGHADTALAFLKRGVPLYMPNKKGALGLHSAAAAGYNDVVKILISRGTKVDIPTKDNYTALHVAVQSGKASVVETLLGYGANVHVHGGQIGETALHVSAALADTECAQMLLKSGAQPNVKQSDGQTSLHIAARSGNVDIVRLMLKEGADPQLKSNNGETPLHVAAKECHYDVIQLILQRLGNVTEPPEVKAYVDSITEDGETSIHYASQIMSSQAHYKDEDAKIISTLLDYGADPAKQTFTVKILLKPSE